MSANIITSTHTRAVVALFILFVASKPISILDEQEKEKETSVHK